jgi:TP901 family phage tail tape measure protein
MAQANLGVRIVLEDGASAGLNALGLSFLGLHGQVGQLALLMNSNLSPTMKGLGAASLLTGDLFHGLAGFMVEATQAAADLESEMAMVTNSVDGADQASDQMKTTLINLADSSKFSTAQIADAFAQIGIDGFNAQQIMSGMGKEAVLLAEALNTQTTPAANLLATAMELYGADASQAAQYTNDLTFLFYHGEKTIANVQAAIAQVGQQAHLLKIPFGELADVLALLGEDGLKGGQGAASLNYYLTALSAPIPKAQKALAALGLMIVNETSPSLQELIKQLRAAGVSADDLKLDGTVSQLQKLFKAGQDLNLIHTDQTFMQWATSLGIVKNKMYDANGQFVGLTASLQKLGDAMQGMTDQQKTDFIANLFNIRSGRAARDFLTDIEKQLDRLKTLDALRTQTDAAQKAGVQMGTLNNIVAQLKSTWTDTMARIGETDLGPIKDIIAPIQAMLHAFNTAGPQVHSTVAVVLLAVTAFTGLIFVVTTIAFVIGVFGSALLAAAPIVIVIAGLITNVTLGALFLKTAFDQASRGVGVLGFLKPVIDLVKQAFQAFGNFIQTQLIPTLAKFAPIIDIIKVILMVTMAVLSLPSSY